MLERKISLATYEEAKRYIPGGVSSPVRSFLHVDMPPMIVERGNREYITDVDGHRYIDYCMSWGAQILGHADPDIVSAVKKQMEKGSSFGITTQLELQMAKQICQCMPWIEKIRFVSSGTEATMSALRLARGYTGKSYCIKCVGNYHGHADPFLVRAGSGVLSLPEASSLGVPKETVQHTICIPYNDLQALEKVLVQEIDIAAIIVEPIAANMGVVPGSREFIQMLRYEADKAGAVLIFDEVITGFRVGLGGAAELFSVMPDLVCLGKIIGGGLPLAAFGGKKEIMDFLSPMGGVYQAGTLSGNPLALSAGIATLQKIQKPGFYAALEEKTRDLLSPLVPLQDRLSLQRVGSMFTPFFGGGGIRSHKDLDKLSHEAFCDFYRFLFDRGVYFSPAQQEANFLSSAHGEKSIAHTKQVLEDFVLRDR